MSTRSIRVRRGVKALAVSAVAVGTALAATVAGAGPAAANGRHHHPKPLGNSSLAALLAKDGTGFDNNPYDFDIADNAVQAVLKANPNSAVGVLAKGDTALTAFLPTDRAFEVLAKQLTGKAPKSESDAFTALAGKLGVPTIESVLLYHVVPGKTITYRQALGANGAKLSTALSGKSIKVHVRYCFFIQLGDNDPDARNPYIVAPDLNKGNKQIAHGIDRVLRPVNL